ncbi:MAG: hypothetical protein SFV21_12400 [Rhodospirillaceae bacterium]|nr:hypothetical protein [Rhodospirillaceae bacterium]
MNAKAWVLNALLIAVSLALAWAAIEGVLAWRAGFSQGESAGGLYRYEDLYVSSQPIAVFDRVSGYRRTPGPTRIVRIVRDQVVFDQTFTPNNAGYISARDYARAKPPGTTRIIVLGDSFTAAEFNPVPWPDRVHGALKGRTAQPVEIYSFAINGAGLGNWHSVFFDDILPHYQFDALVIATYVDNLARGFSYLHYDGPKAWIGYFPTRARSDEDFFTNYLPKMSPHRVSVADTAEIDAIIAGLARPWQWPGLEVRLPALIAAAIDRGAPVRAFAPPAAVTGTLPSVGEIETRYGAVQFALFREIMDAARDRCIPTVLAPIPGRDGAKAAARGDGETPHQLETRALAAEFKAAYVDGYAAFTGVAEADIDRIYWLKYDGHWTQAGSDRFADLMSDYLAAHEPELRGGGADCAK